MRRTFFCNGALVEN
jgi:hypothetical protein